MASSLIASMGALSLSTPSDRVTAQNSNAAARNNGPTPKKRSKRKPKSTTPQAQLQPDVPTPGVEASNNDSSPPQPQRNSPRPPRPRPTKIVKPWKLCADLHDDVQNLLTESNLTFTFRNIDDESSMLKNHTTNIMGRFECTNKRCWSKGWDSKVIPITIRYYANRQYNARVYKQRCKRCNDLGKVQPDGSYAERVVYWLKTWSGVPMDRIEYLGVAAKAPHERTLCEGCKAGICNQGQD